MTATADTARIEERTSRRAWATVVAGVAVFALFGAIALVGVSWYLEHATIERSATARVISGQDALWRASAEDEWSIFNSQVSLSEGDELSTELGTVVWITAFDGSTLEITEQSHIRFERLRESRFSNAATQIRIELQRGSIYGAMAPVSTANYGELEVVTDAMSALLRAERGSIPNPSATFVIEATPAEELDAVYARAAAFRGELVVRSAGDEHVLIGPEQIEFEGSRVASRGAQISSEMIVNGSFDFGLEAWERTYSAEQREAQERAGATDIVPFEDSTVADALHIHRPDSTVWARTGVVQTIDRTLRLPADLTLSFDVLVEHQGAVIDGRSTAPLAVNLNYTDVTGQDREWTTVFTLRREDGLLDADAVTTVRPGEWTKVIVDLQNLEPIPKVLRTMVVYASGGGYDSYIANLSLVTSEGSAAP